MLFSAGLPIFFLEMALGQYAGVGPIKVFGRIAPILQGLGYVRTLYSTKENQWKLSYPFQAVVCVGVLLAFFYNVVVSWSLWYLTVSISSLLLPDSRLEWEYCDHAFNTKCCLSTTKMNESMIPCEPSNITTSVEEYWDRYVLSHIGYDWANYVSMKKLFFFIKRAHAFSFVGDAQILQRSIISGCLVDYRLLLNQRGQILWTRVLYHVVLALHYFDDPSGSEFYLARGLPGHPRILSPQLELIVEPRNLD